MALSGEEGGENELSIERSRANFAKQKAAEELSEMLLKESDRGCALMAAEYLSDEIANLLNLRLVTTGKMRDRMFDVRGPLGTFAGRIDMARAVGVLPTFAWSALRTIRDIRNIFAHTWTDVTFDTKEVEELVKKITLKQNIDGQSNRMTFMKTSIYLCSYIHIQSGKHKKIDDPDDYANHPIEGW